MGRCGGNHIPAASDGGKLPRKTAPEEMALDHRPQASGR